MRGSSSFPRAAAGPPPSGETGYTSPGGSIFKLQANLTTGVSVGGDIATILDRSGNATDATVVSANATYQLVSGKPVIRFNGNSYNVPFSFTNKPANWTIIAVASFATIASSQFICGSIDGSGSTARAWGVVGNVGAALSYQFGDDSTYSYAVGTNPVITANVRSRLAIRYIDGNVGATLNQNGSAVAYGVSGSAVHSTGTEQPFSIGRAGAYTGGFFTGDLYYLQIWPRALTDSELAAVESTLISAGF